MNLQETLLNCNRILCTDCFKGDISCQGDVLKETSHGFKILKARKIFQETSSSDCILLLKMPGNDLKAQRTNWFSSHQRNPLSKNKYISRCSRK